MLRHQLVQFLRLVTRLADIRAACRKAAARLRVDRRGDFALEVDALLLAVNIRGRNRGKQRLGIRMQRRCEQLLCRRVFPPTAPDTSRMMSSEICRTTERSCVTNIYVSPRCSCRSCKQVQHLRLNGNVQRGNRLVTDNKLRAECQCPRNADALTAAAVQLVRIGKFAGACQCPPSPSALRSLHPARRAFV